MTFAHKWEPITDLPSDARSLTDGELESLARVWRAQKEELAEGETLGEFDKRLRREWAIETGIIEDVYTLDRGITKTLIEKGIDAALIPQEATNRDSALVARIIQDHYDVLETLFDFVAGRRELSTSYIKEIHATLLRNVDFHTVFDQFGKAFEKPLEKGKCKTAQNSPTRPDGSVHEYCPPEHVASEMDELIRMHMAHDPAELPPEVEAAWLHHRFTQIHPFADGNGRVARAIASLVFIKAEWFPLIVKRDDRARYIEALEKADEGDLRPLVALFVEAQRNALMQATEVAYDVRPITSAHEAVLAARDRLLQRGKASMDDWGVAIQAAIALVEDARRRLAETAAELTLTIARLGVGYEFDVRVGPEDQHDRFRGSMIHEVGQIPQFNDFNRGVRLNLRTGTLNTLVLSFHAIGPRFRGLIGVVPYFMVEGVRSDLIDGMTFQINYEEDLASAKDRFSKWLDEVIVKGLNMWRRTL